MGRNVFSFCRSLTDIYYTGSTDEWGKIKIDRYGNEKLRGTVVERANIHYNCK